MNANELADELEGWSDAPLSINHKDNVFKEHATMLRQQHAEIEALKDSSYEKGFIDGMAKMTESAVHRAVKGMALKELTDDEIDKVFCEVFCFDKGSKPTSLGYEFCRAILRKAQEK